MRFSVVVSFGISSLTKRRSFPRKRESSPRTAHFRRFVEWIPAFAGMTAFTGPREESPFPPNDISRPAPILRFEVSMKTRRRRGAVAFRGA